MDRHRKIALEITEERVIVIYPDLYQAEVIGVKNMFRQFLQWLWGK